MTVAELKKILDECDDDMEVMIYEYDYRGYTLNHADVEIIYSKNGKPYLRVY